MKNIIPFRFCIMLGIIFCSNCTKKNSIAVLVFEDETTKVFVTNIVDDRCPSDVDCIWAGNAELEMRIEQNMNTTNFSLDTYQGQIGDSQLSRDTTILDTYIELISLEPVPESNENLELDQYIIEVNVVN